MEWVSVEDRLPEKDGYYLFLQDVENLPFVAMFDTTSREITIDVFEKVKPNYWQPLPEPPKQ